MKTVGIFITCVCAVLLIQEWITTPNVPDGPATVIVPSELADELTAAFKNQLYEAAVWSGLLEGMGRFVAADGKADKPLLVTMFDVQKLRDAAVQAPLDRIDGGDDIGRILAPYLKKIGEGNAKLDAGARRQEVADLFIGCGQALR